MQCPFVPADIIATEEQEQKFQHSGLYRSLLSQHYQKYEQVLQENNSPEEFIDVHSRAINFVERATIFLRMEGITQPLNDHVS